LGSATLVIPVGATEQHGPHLPVGVDAVVAAHIATEAAARAATREHSILVAPVLSYGSSHHHLPLAGTLSLSSDTMRRVVYDLLSSAARTGMTKLVVLNGHGGNQDLIGQAARDVALEFDVIAAAASYWTIAADRLQRLAADRGISPVPGHAGAFETSLMLALGLVDRVPEAAPPPARGAVANAIAGVAIEKHAWVHDMGGYSDDPSCASAADGAAFLDVIIDSCAAFLSEFHEGHS
jgi:creatinine amidohydrolase